MDPRKLDRALLMSLVEKHGDPDLVAALRARDGWPDNDADLTGGVADLDDFSACRITRKEDWVDLYAKPFYFGCEADDRTNAWAFGQGNPFGSKLNAIYSSDIGHFDVIDMRDPLPEAYELVEDGLISGDNFRDFTFANAVHLWGTQNPSSSRGRPWPRRPRRSSRARRCGWPPRRLLTGHTTFIGRPARGRDRPTARGRRVPRDLDVCAAGAVRAHVGSSGVSARVHVA